MPTNVRDPRTLVTPEAFELDTRLLGLPLAGPWKRLQAFLIDVVVIGVLTALTSGVQIFVWGVVGAFLVYVTLKKPDARHSRTVGTLFRFFTGCLGVLVLAGVLAAFLLVRLTREAEQLDPDSEFAEALADEGVGGLGELGALIGGIAGADASWRRLAEAETEAEAEEAALGVLAQLDAMGVPLRDEDGDPLDADEKVEILEEILPSDVPWSDDPEEVLARAVARYEDRERSGAGEGAAATPEAGEATPEAGGPASSPEARIAALPLDSVLVWYAGLLDGGSPPDAGPDAERARLLRRRIVAEVGADSLEALADSLDTLSHALAGERRRRERAQAALEAREGSVGSGFVELLRDIWDQAGSAIGLWSIYFTVTLTVFGGRTVGKRVTGLRVRRLDGEPMGWWSAFERSGGYAAGVATGLLGFAQVFWDANRQCVHDKIVGTVVVRDGAEPVPGAWEEAWKEHAEPSSEEPER